MMRSFSPPCKNSFCSHLFFLARSMSSGHNFSCVNVLLLYACLLFGSILFPFCGHDSPGQVGGFLRDVAQPFFFFRIVRILSGDSHRIFCSSYFPTCTPFALCVVFFFGRSTSRHPPPYLVNSFSFFADFRLLAFRQGLLLTPDVTPSYHQPLNPPLARDQVSVPPEM